MALRPRIRVSDVATAMALLAFGAGCASRSSQGSGTGQEIGEVRHIDRVAPPATAVPLAGARCQGEQGEPAAFCRCRGPGDPAETEPPPEGKKRFEIRMAAEGGRVVLDSEVLGTLTVKGAQERCFYVDLMAGSASKFLFHAEASNVEEGVSPFLSIAEYGPAGPFWYDTLVVKCRGQFGRCDRQGADDWKASLAQRKRGRLDPCGSAVVEALGWETSGGQAERDGGLFRDFSVGFQMDVKGFATRFAPGSTECVPK